MSSYYTNGPRIFTPSTLKTTKQFNPIESFGSSAGHALPKTVDAPSPEDVNTCHRARGSYLQTSHPRAPRKTRWSPQEPLQAAAAPLASRNQW